MKRETIACLLISLLFVSLGSTLAATTTSTTTSPKTIKFRGTLTEEPVWTIGFESIGFYTIRIEQILSDSLGRLATGNVVKVEVVRTDVANMNPKVDEVHKGDRVEVFGVYGSTWSPPSSSLVLVPITAPPNPYYIVLISAPTQLVKIRATTVDTSMFQSVGFFVAQIDEIPKDGDPTGRLKIGDRISIDPGDCMPLSAHPDCKIDWPVNKGDKIEVYGRVQFPPNVQPGLNLAAGIWVGPLPQYLIKIKPQADVKYRGNVAQIFGRDYAVTVKEVLDDSSHTLKDGDKTWVTVSGKGQVVGNIQAGSYVEVYGELNPVISPGTSSYQVNVYQSYHYIKSLQEYIKSAILNRNPAVTTQTGLFISIPPTSPSMEGFAWMRALGVVALVEVANPTKDSFDGYVKVYLVDPHGKQHDIPASLFHMDAKSETKRIVYIYYYDAFGGIKATPVGTWYLHLELLKGMIFPTARKVDEKVLNLEVVQDGVTIIPVNAALDAGDVVAIQEFMKGQKPSVFEEYYDKLNLLFLIIQALGKVKAKEACGLGDILPAQAATEDPETISRALGASTNFEMSIEYLGGNQYRITLVYSVSSSTIEVGGHSFSFVNFYDRANLHLLLPKGFKVVDGGGAFKIATAEDGKVEVAWFDYYTDKLLKTSPNQISHSIVVSVSIPACFILESYGYFEVGPFNRDSLGSFPVIDYQQWTDTPSKMVWMLFTTKRDQKALSVVSSASGQLSAFEVSSSSTIVQISNNPDTQSLKITLSGPSGTHGYVAVRIPRDLLQTSMGSPSLSVSLDGKEVPFEVKDTGRYLVVSLSYLDGVHVIELHYGAIPLWTALLGRWLPLAFPVLILAVLLLLLRRHRSTPKIREVLHGPIIRSVRM